MNQEKLFSVQEANAMLATLVPRLGRIREARRELIRSAEQIENRVAIDGGGVAGGSWFEASTILRAEVEAVVADGVILRDPEIGLVDFPSDRDGKGIYLCWKLGEPSVAFWHPLDTGISSRKPV